MRRLSMESEKLQEFFGVLTFQFTSPLLEYLMGNAQGSLYIGMIFDVIIFLVLIVSVLLINSLQMISIETKTFDIGVMRMLGLGKGGLTQSLFI